VASCKDMLYKETAVCPVWCVAHVIIAPLVIGEMDRCATEMAATASMAAACYLVAVT